jgi:hypothetical protein
MISVYSFLFVWVKVLVSGLIFLYGVSSSTTILLKTTVFFVFVLLECLIFDKFVFRMLCSISPSITTLFFGVFNHINVR